MHKLNINAFSKFFQVISHKTNSIVMQREFSQKVKEVADYKDRYISNIAYLTQYQEIMMFLMELTVVSDANFTELIVHINTPSVFKDIFISNFFKNLGLASFILADLYYSLGYKNIKKTHKKLNIPFILPQLHVFHCQSAVEKMISRLPKKRRNVMSNAANGIQSTIRVSRRSTTDFKVDAPTRQRNRNISRDIKYNIRNDVHVQMFESLMPKFNIGASEDLKDVVNILTGSLEKVTEGLTHVNLIPGLSEKMDVGLSHSVPFIEEIIQKIQKKFSDYSIEFKTFLYAITILFLFMKSREKGSHFIWKIILGAVIAYAIYLNYENLKKFCFTIISYDPSVIEPKGSAGDSEDSGIHAQADLSFIGGPLVTSMLGLIYFNTYKKSVGPELLPKFFSSLSHAPQTKAGIEFSMKYVLKIIEQFVNYLLSFGSYEPLKLVPDYFPEIKVFQERVLDMMNLYQEGMTLNYDNGQRVYALIKEGNDLLFKIPNTVDCRDVRTNMLQIISTLKPIATRLERANIVGNGPRREPLGILIGGPPGVGKSIAMIPMMLSVMARVLPEDKLESFANNHNDFIYNRVSENEFYDGYHGQFVFNFDEIGQTVDVPGVNANPFMEAIRAINTCNFPLHMAHLEDKANTNFVSEIVCATTNRTFFDLSSLYKSEAFIRRWKIALLHVPKKEFCTEETRDEDLWKRRLDLTKIKRMDYSHNEYYPYDYKNGVVKGGVMSFDEVVDLIVATYESTRDHGDELLQHHQDLKRKLINSRKIQKQMDIDDFLNSVPSLEHLKEQKIKDVLDDHELAIRFQDLKGDKFVKTRHGVLRYNEGVEKSLHGLSNEKKEDFLLLGNRMADSMSKMLDPDPIVDYPEEFYEGNVSMVDFAKKQFKKISSLDWSFLSNTKFLFAVSAAIPLISIAYTLLFSTQEPLWHETLPQTGPLTGRAKRNAKRHAVRKYTKNLQKTVQKLENVKIDKQLAMDPQASEIALKIYKRNLYFIRPYNSIKNMGYALFIKGRVAIMPLHFVDYIDEKIEDGSFTAATPILLIKVSNPNIKVEVSPLDLDMVMTEAANEDDYAFVQFPKVVPMHADLTHHFVDDEDVNLSNAFTGALLLARDHCFQYCITKCIPITGLVYDDYKCDYGFSYDIPTKEGDCTAPLFICNPTTRAAKIVGIHVAGQKGCMGMAVRVSRWDVENGLTYFDEQVGEELEVDGNFHEVEMQGFTALQFSEKLHQPIVTSITKSPLCDAWGETKCAPALLKATRINGCLVDPNEKARSNYVGSNKLVNIEVLNLCRDSYFNYICKNASSDNPWAPRVFTFEEAVAGIPGVPFCEGIPRQTSSGYPFCLNLPKGFKGKEHYFGKEGDYEFSSAHCMTLRSQVDDLISKAKKGIRSKVIFADFLKDERRKIPKVKLGKTRLISASPIDYLIACRMYFMDFIRWYMSNRIRNGSAVGINAYSDEWHMLYKYMSTVGKDTIAGDYSAYDGTISIVEMETFLHVANQWYSDGNDIIRTTLFAEVINSRHIAADIVYEWFGCNPSGNPLTTALNTFVNNVIIRYVFVLSYSQKHFDSINYPTLPLSEASNALIKFEDQVRVTAYGDDNVICISKAMKEYLSQDKLTLFMKYIGKTYTSELKEGEVANWRTLEDVSFLKRHFLFDKLTHKYIAPLDIETILEIPYWTKRKDTDYNFTRTNVDTALGELSLHSVEVFEKWAPKIISASQQRLGYAPIRTSYKSLHSHTLAREEMW